MSGPVATTLPVVANSTAFLRAFEGILTGFGVVWGEKKGERPRTLDYPSVSLTINPKSVAGQGWRPISHSGERRSPLLDAHCPAPPTGIWFAHSASQRQAAMIPTWFRHLHQRWFGHRVRRRAAAGESIVTTALSFLAGLVYELMFLRL